MVCPVETQAYMYMSCIYTVYLLWLMEQQISHKKLCLQGSKWQHYSCEKKAWKKTAKVASITAMIYFHIILFPLIHIMIFIIFVTLIIIFSWIYNEPIQRHAFGLLAQLVRALNRYDRGQGFKSHTSLNSFQAFFLQLQKLHSITTMIYFHIILHPAVHIYDFHIFIT